MVIPLVVLVIVAEKAIVLFRTVVAPISDRIAIDTIGGEIIARLIAFAVLLLICFLVGLFAKTNIAQRYIDWLEDNVLSVIPGYTFLKGMGETMAGLQSEKLQNVVLVDLEEVWQIGFLMDHIDADLVSVFIPGAPNPLAGDIVIVKNSNHRILDIRPSDALKLLRTMGSDSKRALRGNVSIKSFE